MSSYLLKIHSNKTLNALKKMIPEIRKIWGTYSENFSHFSCFHKDFNPIETYTKKNNALSYSMYNLYLMLFLIHIISERTFLEDMATKPVYWKYKGEGRYDLNFKKIDEYMKLVGDF